MNIKKTEKDIQNKLKINEKTQMQIEENKESIISTKTNKKDSKQQEHKGKQWTKTSKYFF